MTSTDDTQPETGSGGSSRNVRMEYDWTSVSPSTAVTETIAAATGREPTAMTPLYRYVDLDALDHLVRSSASVGRQETVTVGFDFEKFHVAVTGDGLVVVDPV